MRKNKLTHGEKFYFLKTNINLKDDTITICRRYDSLPKKMNRESAISYYGDKIKKYFGIDVVKPKDFRHIEEFYDYHEALRMKKELHGKRLSNNKKGSS